LGHHKGLLVVENALIYVEDSDEEVPVDEEDSDE